MYEILAELLDKYDLTLYKLSKESGVAYTTLADWKNGKSTPNAAKLQKIANYFNVSMGYLLTGEEKEGGEKYYLNEETASIAQEIFESKELRGLFDVARSAPPERLKAYYDMIKALEGKENNRE